MMFRGDHQYFGGRLRAVVLVICTLIGLLGVRLWYLQGINGAHFRDLSENNRTRTIRTIAPRGNIYARDDRLLVRNRPAYNIALMMEDVPDLDLVLSRLAEITGRDAKALREHLDSQKWHRPFEPKVVLADVGREELAKIKVNSYRLPGVIVEVTPTRSYPYHSTSAHILGYVREIGKAQLEADTEDRYQSGDMVGQEGVEKEWEDVLRGEAGFVRVEVDAMGNRRGELGIVDNKPGQDLYLTLDLDMQRAAEEALAGEKGVVVALDPQNGEVLALASSPSFDANVFSGQISLKDWNRITKDKAHPLTNRAIAARYAPGSTFKLFMAVAGLAEGKITPQTHYYCPGYYLFAGRRYHCHKRSGHGSVDLHTAITVSCDSYFYQLGQALGINTIHKYSVLFGLGGLSGIKLPSEKKGIVPSEEWKLKYLGDRWYAGETLSVAIGQGYLTVTPLQMAIATAALANGGKVYRPTLVRKVVNRNTGEVKEFQPELIRTVGVDEKILADVRQDALAVVEDARGTGKRAAIEGIQVAGKTGTAQVVSLGKETMGKQFQDHAWFVSFAPVDDARIALAIIVENGGHGGSTAAPISKAVMEVFFRKRGILPPLYGPELPPGFMRPQLETQEVRDGNRERAERVG